MDKNTLTSAVEKAIRSGAVAAPPVEALGSDASWIRTQTDIAIEPAVFDTYLLDLKADPDMAAFDGTFANLASGGGVSVGVPGIARLLLARCISTNDVAGTVERFISYVTDNAANATAVLAVSGAKVDEAIRLGPDVTIIATTALQPSMQRGTALGQDAFAAMGRRIAIPCVLTTPLKFGPVFYIPKTPQPSGEMDAYVSAEKAQSVLEEALDLLSVMGIYPHYQMSWLQPDDLLMSSGMSGGWSFSTYQYHLGQHVTVPKDPTEKLGEAYFSIDRQKRSKMLRIPLDRLGRAGRERDISDRAIDLGIALESLLLHDLADRGELSFRLSLRGAWLLGDTAEERVDIQKALRALYDLRSRAVHSGFVDRTPETEKVITRATEICQALIWKIIKLKCQVDWQAIVVGDRPTT